MDVIDSCKKKLEYFRVRELKDVLARAGFSKQGRKQELLDKVLALLCDEGTPNIFRCISGKEELVSIIDNTYRKMEDEGVVSSAKRQNSTSNCNPKVDESLPKDALCLCGCSICAHDAPMKCSYGNCNTWRHSGCVHLPEQLEAEELPDKQFLCELCRINQADPFWVTISYLLDPVKLAFTNVPAEGSKPLQYVEKTFFLSRANKDVISKTEYDLQAWCVLLGDSVPFRIHWPQHAKLLVNDFPFRTYGRPSSQKLGANGRDDGARITIHVVDGVNKITLSGCDDRNFCFGVRLVKRQTIHEVLSMVPEESTGELFEDAVARVQRCIGGGPAVGDLDGETDLEVVTDLVTFSLRCPMSGGRIKTAGRFKPCVHMGCFDLETFVQLTERSRKWQCPICLKNYSLKNLIIDPYFNRIVSMLRHCEEEISEIVLKPDGTWRVKSAHSIGHLGMWHLADGSVMLDAGSLKLTMHENGGGDDAPNCSLNNFEDIAAGEAQCLSHYENQPINADPEVIAMSSTNSGDAENDVATSVNQHFDEQVGDLRNCEIDVDSISREGEGRRPVVPNSTPQAGEAEIIVLSDSEEDEAIHLPRSHANSIEPSNCRNEMSSSLPSGTFPEVGPPDSGNLLPSQNGTHDGNGAPLEMGHVPNGVQSFSEYSPIRDSNIIAEALSDKDTSRKRLGEDLDHLVPRQPRSVRKRSAKISVRQNHQ